MARLRARDRWEEKGQLARWSPCTGCALRGITYPPMSENHPHAVFWATTDQVASAIEEWRKVS
jgi:hypothetical protein